MKTFNEFCHLPTIWRVLISFIVSLSFIGFMVYISGETEILPINITLSFFFTLFFNAAVSYGAKQEEIDNAIKSLTKAVDNATTVQELLDVNEKLANYVGAGYSEVGIAIATLKARLKYEFKLKI